MASNRRYTSQFSRSWERQPVRLMSSWTQTGLGTVNALTNQGLTYTSALFGALGAAITIRLLDPLASGAALSISVSGSAITAHLATSAGVAATASLATTTPIVLTSVATGSARNTTTVHTVVNAAAANPTNTVLAAITGTSAAIIITITPNDGTNNSATPVNITAAQLTELINTGLISGKVITLTDASSLRILQTATGGGAVNLASGGEGDNKTATFSGGITAGAITTTATLLAAAMAASTPAAALVTVTGSGSSPVTALAATHLSGGTDSAFTQLASFAGMTLLQLGTGLYRVSLRNSYAALLSPSIDLQRATAVDLLPQIVSSDTQTAQTVEFRMLAGATPTNMTTSDKITIGLTLRNSANSTGSPI